jgi:outer membrane immunogenic protein
MLVLVARACRIGLLALLGACLTQAASATEFVFPSTPKQSEGPDWAGPYLQNNSAGSAGIPWATPSSPGGFSSLGTASPAVSDSFGYNFQSGNFVFGLEGSLSAANVDGKFTASYLPASAWTPNMGWLGTVTGRIGYAFGQWLPYVKGGFAAAEVGSPLSGAPTGGFSQGTGIGGWTAGVGLEYQLSSKWSLGLEYLYTDLGNGNATGAPATIAGSPGSGPEVYSTAVKTQSLLGRLNYKAGW